MLAVVSTMDIAAPPCITPALRRSSARRAASVHQRVFLHQFGVRQRVAGQVTRSAAQRGADGAADTAAKLRTSSASGEANAAFLRRLQGGGRTLIAQRRGCVDRLQTDTQRADAWRAARAVAVVGTPGRARGRGRRRRCGSRGRRGGACRQRGGRGARGSGSPAPGSGGIAVGQARRARPVGRLLHEVSAGSRRHRRSRQNPPQWSASPVPALRGTADSSHRPPGSRPRAGAAAD